MTTRVSLAELAAADVQLRPAEAVAVVAEICRQYSSGQLHGIPSPGVIGLTRDGAVVAQGPTTTDAVGVRRAAHLLSDLLPDFDVPADYRASGGLRLVIARALGTLDLPPYQTLDEFCQALGRFAAPDLGTTARGLFAAWEQVQATRCPPAAAPSLTISDIRRARRATGLSLDELSAVAEVPAARLRELEWGYFRNWRADEDGRAQVIRYARAAGLDEEIVLSIAWPMIQEDSAPASQPGAVVSLVPAGPLALAVAGPIVRRPPPSRLVSWSVAAVAAALLALATYTLFSGTSPRRGPVRTEAVYAPVVSREADRGEPAPPAPSAPAPAPAPVPVSGPGLASAPAPRPAPVSASAPGSAPALAPAPASVPASAAVGSTRRRAPARAAVRPAGPPRPGPAPREKSIFRKELFRIVIR